jgi:hypothetical protein
MADEDDDLAYQLTRRYREACEHIGWDDSRYNGWANYQFRRGQIIMSPPSPLLALSTANWVLAATEARPYGKIRLNTNGWERGRSRWLVDP